ncbi:MAG: NADH-quinone oxidoreductase subunit L [Candidatus Dadabacteria bacterium]|nr:NADH-quinone oxidoreductase subunit L [Candidatus Dadabacteria bacterium]NIS08653.1 NADH-quinone oxidoreductase subunit L [Candidatus Dadabacteria bacterium]NIV42487.1 NADH-quinone oxidoreductase subunit L [Candidatus Dadabacteria bacterium]NIX15369.1 NADH-quinone oxidoreductase subunit L [Candidatus Dadabacteria bacterium]NIY22028.1 NADH-quinone oxidoreductase subunit L [Candidatus Dadabacteria bacterium]
MLFLIILLPLIGAAINGLVFSSGLVKKDHESEKSIVSIVACSSILFSALIATYLFFQLIGSDNSAGIIQTSFSWIVSGELDIKFGFLFDNISAIMTLVITWVGFLIHIYSIGYMSHDKSYARYFTYLNLFVFFMLVLVLGNNFPLMFVGWEGVGLASYLLIGFWYDDDQKALAGRKAFIVNRIGDFGFLIAIFLIFITFGSLSYADIFSGPASQGFIDNVPAITITAITLLLFVGAVGKSAQFPLYVWLPDAMAGPTPVSALIHAATMVTAGVYMVTRCAVFFSASPLAQFVVVTIAVFTAFFAATIALSQTDIKKVLAYSTVSQLGFMFMGVGIGAYAAGMFHLVTHAFFKALLFLGAGSVIHAMSDEQDVRKMGGLRRYLPVTSKTFLIGTLAISGLPLLSGFFSKDQILGELYERGYAIHWGVAIFTALLTALYMMRLYFLTFEGTCRVPENIMKKLHESPSTMTVPLVVLAVLSVIGGYVGVPDFIGEMFGIHHINKFKEFIWAAIPLEHHSAVGNHFFGHMDLLVLSIIAAVLGIGLAYYFYIYKPKHLSKIIENEDFGFLYNASNSKWYMDEVYEHTFVDGFKETAKMSFWFDSNIVDGLVNRVAGFFSCTSNFVRKFQFGLVRLYAAVMTAGLILILYIIFLTF